VDLISRRNVTIISEHWHDNVVLLSGRVSEIKDLDHRGQEGGPSAGSCER
jgi:hypothetical protein